VILELLFLHRDKPLSLLNLSIPCRSGPACTDMV